MTPTNQKYLDYIIAYCESRSYSPTYQEIGDHFRVNKVTAFEHVRALVAMQLLTIKPRCKRSIRLPVKPSLTLLRRVLATLRVPSDIAGELESVAKLMKAGR